MNYVYNARQGDVDKFWLDYSNAVLAEDVQKERVTWYLKHAQSFIKEAEGLRGSGNIRLMMWCVIFAIWFRPIGIQDLVTSI